MLILKAISFFQSRQNIINHLKKIFMPTEEISIGNLILVKLLQILQINLEIIHRRMLKNICFKLIQINTFY